MAVSNVAISSDHRRDRIGPVVNVEGAQVQDGAVAWGAIVAGAAAAAALSLILLMLGIGLGLSSVSPWSQNGVSAAAFGISTIVWITFTQLAASAMGGYLAGRLRTKWVAAHTDEVYFRDTAHGFLSWAIASLATAALLTSTIASIVGGGMQAGATVAGGVASAATAGGVAAAGAGLTKSGEDSAPNGYFIDTLFRKDANNTSSTAVASPDAASTSEVTRIFMNSIRTATLPPEDLRYVGQVISQRIGVSQQDAEKRVSDTYARMQTKLRDAEAAVKEAADKARKASAYAVLWLFISLLIGVFVASFAATYGGRHRDI